MGVVLTASMSLPAVAADWVVQRLTNADGTLSSISVAYRDLNDNGALDVIYWDLDGNGSWETVMWDAYGGEHLLENLALDFSHDGVWDIYAVNTDQFGDFDCLMTFDPVYGWTGGRAQPLPMINPNPHTMLDVPCTDPYNPVLNLIGTGGTGVSGRTVGGYGPTPDSPGDLVRGYFTQLQQCANFTILDSNTHCMVSMPAFYGR